MKVKGEEGIKDLLKANLVRWECPATEKLFEKIADAKEQGDLGKEEFLQICYWKSPRNIRYACLNDKEKIESAFELVLGYTDEIGKIIILDDLDGVGVKTASAILTLINPENYGVLDMWVWRLLCCYGIFNRRHSGTGLTYDDWYEYEEKLRDWRDWARKNVNDGESITARNIEKTLFLYAAGGIPEGLYTDRDIMSLCGR